MKLETEADIDKAIEKLHPAEIEFIGRFGDKIDEFNLDIMKMPETHGQTIQRNSTMILVLETFLEQKGIEKV